MGTGRETAPAVGIAVGLAGLTGAQGGYFPASWEWTPLALLWAAGLALAFATRVELGRAEIAFLVLLGGLTGWIALSSAWSSSTPQTVDEVERALLYLAGAAAFAFGARRAYISYLLAAVLAALTGISATRWRRGSSLESSRPTSWPFTSPAYS